MKLLSRLLIGLPVILVAALLLAGAAGYLFVQRGLPQTTGTIQVSGLHAPVQVVRDSFGIPQIYADNLEDLFFAQGYVTAQDRLWQMEFQRRVGHGRLSEVLGKSTLKTDRFLRTIGTSRAAEQDLAALDPETRTILEAYARGVNAFIGGHKDNLPLEFTILSFTPAPWQPVDSLVWAKMMAWDLGGNWESELLRTRLIAVLGEERARQLLPAYPEDAPTIVEGAREQGSRGAGEQGSGGDGYMAMLGDLFTSPAFSTCPPAPLLPCSLASQGLGSNNWVVDGTRSVTGKPLLANDPHLSIQMPSIWYEIGLHGAGFDVVGASLPGAPGVVIGHNSRIAWGMTNVGPDVQDLYVEHVRSEGGRLQAEFRGQWEEVKVIRDEIPVKGQAPDVLEIRITRHGPLLNDVVENLKEPVAFKWTATAEKSRVVGSIARLNRAQNFDEFRQALRTFDVPAQNFVYADVDGNIGYQTPGLIPIRMKGRGEVPVPGWTGEYEWTGYVPFDELPSVYNPPTHVIVTANNRVVPESYPYFISSEWAAPYRAQRIIELLGQKEKLSPDDFKALQADTFNVRARILMPYLLALKPEGWLQEKAMDQLRAWDLNNRADSAAASIFEVTYREIVTHTFSNKLPPDLFKDYLGNATAHHMAMQRILPDPDNPWFDDVNTPIRETRDIILQKSFAGAVDWLGRQMGDVPAEWGWGRLHTATFVHRPLGQSGIAVLEKLFNRGPIPARGSSYTVNAASFKYTQPYGVSSLASYRQVIDLSDFANSWSIHTTGQSGQLLSPHYDDFIGRWQAVEYHPMRFDVTPAADGARLTLTP